MPVRVVVANGGFQLLNHGDIAMLQVCVSRIREKWPNAMISVITLAPERLATLCPGTLPLEPGRGPPAAHWGFRGFLAGLLGRHRQSSAELVLAETISQADVVVDCGGGNMTDTFRHTANKILSVLDRGLEAGSSVACFGQGIGPNEDERLLTRMRNVLPRLDLIAVREGLRSPSALESIGVPKARISITGDDAIAPAYAARPSELGKCIGFNVRLAKYAGLTMDDASACCAAVVAAAGMVGARVVPLPISGGVQDSDHDALRRLLGENSDLDPLRRETTESLLQQVARCRLVITGSYHAAVFALAQGASVIGLAKSVYYRLKFQGLAHQFGVGCACIVLDESDPERMLGDVILRLWEQAPAVRDRLLASARAQIVASSEAYDEFFSLVDSRLGARPAP